MREPVAFTSAVNEAEQLGISSILMRTMASPMLWEALAMTPGVILEVSGLHDAAHGQGARHKDAREPAKKHLPHDVAS